MRKIVNKILILYLAVSIFYINAGSTVAYFSDTAKVEGNIVSTGYWVTPTPPEPTPTETPPEECGNVVVNEVYYDVAPGMNEGNLSNPDEWVELYNNCEGEVNLKNWTLSDNNGTATISHSNKSISGKGFAVLAKSASTFVLWSIPTDAEKMELGQKIGNGLANNGDRVVLKDDGGNEIDAVSWGSDEYAFALSGGKLLTGDGKSIARVIKGVDTDVQGDWQILDSPNPGTNPHSLLLPLSIFTPPEQPSPELEFFFEEGKTRVGFEVKGGNLKDYDLLTYLITYDSNGVIQAVSGGINIDGKSEITVNNILLGMCSSGGTCVYDSGITKIDIKVVLKGALDKELTSQLIY